MVQLIRSNSLVLKFLDTSTFITLSTIISIASAGLYLLNSLSWAFVLAGIILQTANTLMAILCWIRNKHSPYAIALSTVNISLYAVIMLLFICAPQTITIKNFFKEIMVLDTWDWVAFVLGSVTLIFAACTWSSQEKTQRNTLQITSDGQYNLLSDSVRDTYRNISLIYAIEFKMKDLFGKYYPSDELLLRMCTDDRAIYPSLFAEDNDKCCRLQRYRVNTRNANTELRIIVERFKDSTIKPELHIDDLRMLKERIEGNIERLHKLLVHLWEYDKDMANKLCAYIIDNAANCNDDKEQYSRLLNEADEKFDSGELEYFYPGVDINGQRTEFIKLLFPEPNYTEEAEFIRKLNKNIYTDAHLHGRIRLIPYDPSLPLIF